MSENRGLAVEAISVGSLLMVGLYAARSVTDPDARDRILFAIVAATIVCALRLVM